MDFRFFCHCKMSKTYDRPMSGMVRASGESSGRSHLSKVRAATLKRTANSARVIPS